MGADAGMYLTADGFKIAPSRHISARRNSIALFQLLLSSAVNNKHRKTLEAVLADPVNANVAWSRIESLLLAIGCRVIEGSGSAVTFEHSGRRASFHRPHPAKEALRYRVLAVREFLDKIGAMT